MDFAERLRDAMAEKKISQNVLAKKIGKRRETVRDYCSGKSKPSLEALKEICEVLGVSADFLLGLVE